MFGVNSNFGRDPIGKLQNWHDGAVAKQKRADEAADRALYNSTVEKFESALSEITQLDGSKALLKMDTESKAGEVNVPGVGSLRKTSEGFILETVKTFPGMGLGALGFMAYPTTSAGLAGGIFDRPTTMLSHKEIFTVNTEERTIRHESRSATQTVYPYGAPPALGSPWLLPTEVTVSDVTIRTSDESVVKRQKAADELGYLSPSILPTPQKGLLDLPPQGPPQTQEGPQNPAPQRGFLDSVERVSYSS